MSFDDPEEDSATQRQHDQVVNDSPQEIDVDSPDRRLREIQQRADVEEGVLHENGIRGVDGDVGSGPDGDSEIRLAQGAGIVDSVADKRDDFSSLVFLEKSDSLDLLIRKAIGEDFEGGDADALGDRFRRFGSVARDHPDLSLDDLTEVGNCGRGVLFDGVGEMNCGDEATIDGDTNHDFGVG